MMVVSIKRLYCNNSLEKMLKKMARKFSSLFFYVNDRRRDVPHNEYHLQDTLLLE